MSSPAALHASRTLITSCEGGVRIPGNPAGRLSIVAYRYSFDAGVVLPAGSDARDLVAAMKVQHPGVQIAARTPRQINVSAFGSVREGPLVAKVAGQIAALNDGKVLLTYGLDRELDPGFFREILGIGLLAGLGVGLAIVVPARRRVTPCPAD
jgi:hypothetical protein